MSSQQAQPTSRPALNANMKPVGAPKSQFNQFSLDYSRLLMDDFVHLKFMTVKFTGKGTRFAVNGKETVEFKKNKDGVEAPVVSEEIKYVTNIRGRNVEAKFNSKGLIRFWANMGTYNLGEEISLFTKLKTTKDFKTASGHVAGEYNGPRCQAQVRFDIKKNWEPFFNNKVIITEGKMQFGYVAKLSLRNFNLTRYNLFGAYRHKQFDAYLEHISNNKEKVQLGEIVASGIYKHAGHQFIAKVAYDRSKDVAVKEGEKKPNPFLIELGSLYNVNKDTAVRAKINSNADLALNLRQRFNSNFSLVAGTNIDLRNPGSYSTGKTIPIPLGLQAEFTFN